MSSHNGFSNHSVCSSLCNRIFWCHWKVQYIYIYIYIYTHTRMSQKFFRIMWDTIWLLWMLFAKVMRVMNHTGLWDGKFVWYYPNVSEFAFMTWSTAFRPTWLCPIVRVLVIQVNFLEPSGYYTCTTNVFKGFSSFIVQFEFIKHKFPH